MKRSVPLAGLWALVICAGARAEERCSVVAPDGTGQFKSVQEAIMAVPQTGTKAVWTILIKPGTYKEQIYIQRERGNLLLKGEDAEKTVLTFDLNANLPGRDGKPIGTFRTASTAIDADDVTAENLTFENSAGPVGQALAIRIDGDRVAFRKCRFLGWQDTILTNRGRQYFEGCTILGHVDFIFGGATAFFEDCHIVCLRDGYITTASTPKDQPFGYVFSNCRVTGQTPEVRTYLGRPWRDYAAVVFLNTRMSEVVRPEGWHNWGKPEREKTTRYAEYGSTGPGANPKARAAWARQLTLQEAKGFTAAKVLAGQDGWNPGSAPGSPVRASAKADLKAVQLRCEYIDNPMGVDVTHPGLSWIVEASDRGQVQTGYQILVASSARALSAGNADLWDSGRRSSNQAVQIPYAGRALTSGQQVFWKVRLWDGRGAVSAWSRPGSWTMGLLVETDWQVRWIGASTDSQTLMLRRSLVVKPGLTRALAFVCGLGQYEISVNGSKAGDDVLSPGWTKYDKTCLYDTRDITSMLHKGDNAVGLLLGSGMYNVPGGRYTKFKGSFGPVKAICQIRVDYADGTHETVATDDQWRVSAGAITFCCVYGGEDYDSQMEPKGWTRPGFDDSRWAKARIMDGPGGALRGLSCAAPALRTFEVFRPIGVRSLREGVTAYDLGQNAALMPRLKVKGPAGSSVTLTPAELTGPDGSADRGSCGGGQAYWKYTLAGGASETWFPRFFYQGCRFIQVDCAPVTAGGRRPVVEALEGVVVRSASTPVGQFACSNDLFNRIHTLVRWAQRSNMVSVMTDCPHREKLGWLEQYHLNGPSLRYEFDLARLFTKGMNDMADSQLEGGLIPDIAPEYTVFQAGFRDSPEWGSAFIIVPWQQYEWTGDLGLLSRHYDAMARYVAYLGTKASDHIVSHGLGDWYDLGPNPPGEAQLTPKALTATAFYYYDTWIMARAAALLGKADDARRYTELAGQIRAAFNTAFFNTETHQYATGSQCANSIPLVMGLAEPADRQAVLDAVVADVRGRGNALTAGDVGYRYLLRALAEGGRSDVVFAMNNQSDKPGYGYQLRQGATSLTEAWDAGRGSSQNHFMLGQIVEWLYHDLAGIQCDPNGPGFAKIVIRPQPVGDLTWVKASYDSVRGRIVSEWKKDSARFTLRVTIPANTTATVFIPAASADRVTEGRLPASKAKGVRFLRQEAGQAVYQIGSGRYEFSSWL
jgi:pectin methylesterase-like acyl-CoA thioesterase